MITGIVCKAMWIFINNAIRGILWTPYKLQSNTTNRNMNVGVAVHNENLRYSMHEERCTKEEPNLGIIPVVLFVSVSVWIISSYLMTWLVIVRRALHRIL